MTARRSREVDQIPVRISYEIIRLFSEGLYRGPNKAVEELVCNSYDADAKNVRIVLPKTTAEETDFSESQSSLWVIDDGCGMDEDGFRHLWRVADSNKSREIHSATKRALIGQFGIGKLAAYVLGWKLTHVSRVNSRFLLTEMDFHEVVSVTQNDSSNPVNISLQEVEENTAMNLLSEIKERDTVAWDSLFGSSDTDATWTVARVSDFKDLYKRLTPARLRWVLSTGLPLQSEFKVWVNCTQVQSSKEQSKKIETVCIGGMKDKAAKKLGFRVHNNAKTSVDVPGIGQVSGVAEVFERPLTGKKSEFFGRSNGFFVRVRGRVINLEDELFGLPPQNHAAWSRFALEIHADGLHDQLLSSREGVKDSESIDQLRRYLQELFNLCRTAFDAWNQRDDERLDLAQLHSSASSALVLEPLLDVLRQTIMTENDSFYVEVPCKGRDIDCREWLNSNEERLKKSPFKETKLEREGFHSPALRYLPEHQMIRVNSDHPFVDKLTGSGKRLDSATLFGYSELLLEGQLYGRSLSTDVISELLRDRDRVLRLIAGQTPPTAAQVLRYLSFANENSKTLERAVGTAFQTLGFEYQRNGGHAPGPDGVLEARLGRQNKSSADYRLVYDAKQTNQFAVPADKIDLVALENFRLAEKADYGFFIANSYAAESDPNSTLNMKIKSSGYKKITLLKLVHLEKVVRLHYRYGVTLTELRKVFEGAQTVPEVDSALLALDNRLQKHQIPLGTLFKGLEELKSDLRAIPDYKVVRFNNASLREFEPERLAAALKGVQRILGQRWLKVEDDGSVTMHQSSDEILKALKNRLASLDLSD